MTQAMFDSSNVNSVVATVVRPSTNDRTFEAAAPGTTGVKRVLLAGRLTSLSVPGGGEVQLRSLAAALCDLNVDARLWRPWDDALDEVDLVHLVGSGPELVDIALSARRRGKPVVLSPVAWFNWASRWGEFETRWQAARGLAMLGCRRLARNWTDWRRKLYDLADLLLPNSSAEAAQLEHWFGIDPSKMCVVPNGADARFAHAHSGDFVRRTGSKDFVLCAGRIEPRKNQLQLIEAMRGTGIGMVILGDTVPGHESYARRCRQAADKHVQFLPAWPHDHPALASAYAAARCLVLASWYETPGLVALEAGMSGLPLVLSQLGAGREYFGPHAQYVWPGNQHEIREAVLTAYRQPRSAALARLVQQNYTWRTAAALTQAAYARIC